MKNKRILLLTVILILTQFVSDGNEKCDTSETNSGLRIYLPREAEVKKDLVTLGDISVIKGDQSLVNKANSIVLGKFSMPFQTIGLSRSMILGRLASEGIVNKEVKITGAEKITITRQSTIIKSDKLIKTAEYYLKEKMSSESVSNIKAVGLVKDVELPGYFNSIKIVPSLTKSDLPGKAKINVAVMSGQQMINQQQIEFRLSYKTNQIVASHDIRRGEALNSENIQVTEEVSNKNLSKKLRQPYGLIARRMIYTGNVITDSMVDSPNEKVLIKRNDNVAVTVKKPGMFLQAIGKSLEDGRIGDFIKIKMQISNVSRVIYAQVKPDGTVEPMI